MEVFAITTVSQSKQRGQGRFPEKDNVIFAIDASPLMHDKDEDGVSYFQAALRCVSRFLQTKIVQSESDLMGLVLFGTVRPAPLVALQGTLEIHAAFLENC